MIPLTPYYASLRWPSQQVVTTDTGENPWRGQPTCR